MVLEFFEHPLAIDTALGGVMEDVDLPKREQKFANDRVSHVTFAF